MQRGMRTQGCSVPFLEQGCQKAAEGSENDEFRNTKEREDKRMAMLSNDWAEALKEEFRKPYYKELYTFIREEYNSRVVYPPSEDIFNPIIMNTRLTG